MAAWCARLSCYTCHTPRHLRYFCHDNVCHTTRLRRVLYRVGSWSSAYKLHLVLCMVYSRGRAGALFWALHWECYQYPWADYRQGRHLNNNRQVLLRLQDWFGRSSLQACLQLVVRVLALLFRFRRSPLDTISRLLPISLLSSYTLPIM